MSKQLRHQSLAKTHYFEIGFSFRVEIGSAFSAAHRQSSEGVLEYLFEGKKLENAEVDRRVKSHSALVGADCAVHLDPEPAIDMELALIIAPWHPEHDHSLRLNNSLQDLGRSILRMAIENKRERLHHFLDSLMEFRFSWISCFNVGDHF